MFMSQQLKKDRKKYMSNETGYLDKELKFPPDSWSQMRNYLKIKQFIRKEAKLKRLEKFSLHIYFKE